jgi:hypothetical protein
MLDGLVSTQLYESPVECCYVGATTLSLATFSITTLDTYALCRGVAQSAKSLL